MKQGKIICAGPTFPTHLWSKMLIQLDIMFDVSLRLYGGMGHCFFAFGVVARPTGSICPQVLFVHIMPPISIVLFACSSGFKPRDFLFACFHKKQWVWFCLLHYQCVNNSEFAPRPFGFMRPWGLLFTSMFNVQIKRNCCLDIVVTCNHFTNPVTWPAFACTNVNWYNNFPATSTWSLLLINKLHAFLKSWTLNCLASWLKNSFRWWYHAFCFSFLKIYKHLCGSYILLDLFLISGC